MWDVSTGEYTVIGFKEDTDSDEESPVALKARQSTRRLQNAVSREGVEAF